MSGKQITELESTNVFAEGDLLLTRKTTSGTDKKINYTDLIESIGNPAIDGFVATQHPTESNTIILTPANNARIPRYFVGMKISFVSPIKNTFDVKIKIGNLPSIDFLQYQSIQGVSLEIDDYVEGVFIANKFYQINNFKAVSNIYSDEYSVVATSIEDDESFTTLTLSSAIGLRKNAYYDSMSINFICPQDTKGGTRVTIDAIPNAAQWIFEPGTPIGSPHFSKPLFSDQIVRAIYSSAQGGFIKDRFTVQDPTIVAVNITQNPTEEEIENGEMPPLIIPPQNSLEYSVDNVSTGINSFSTLKECIEKILSNFPSGAESGVKVTITINKILDASSTLFTVDRDLSWITLRSVNQSIVIDKKQTRGYIFTQINGSFFNFEENTTILVNNTPINETLVFIQASNGIINFKNLTINISNGVYVFSLNNGCTLTLTNCNLLNARNGIYIINSNVTLNSCTIKNWVNYAMFISSANKNTVILNNCDLRTASSSSIYDITTTTNTFIGSEITVNQTNTKAKMSYAGTEIAPNTSMGNVKYNVSGGQN